jgi:hypothetical protein
MRSAGRRQAIARAGCVLAVLLDKLGYVITPSQRPPLSRKLGLLVLRKPK